MTAIQGSMRAISIGIDGVGCRWQEYCLSMGWVMKEGQDVMSTVEVYDCDTIIGTNTSGEVLKYVHTNDPTKADAMSPVVVNIDTYHKHNFQSSFVVR
ncbi:BOD1L1 [Acrasis kona]|uniref:BOD1L1 n=1 Tax=Acrasis kona TaxID=1008807 RepID=A0AAW2YV75_9EUKA